MGPVISEPGNASNPYLNRIRLVSGDITAQDTDAIVSVLPQSLEYRGEINTAILSKAGEALDHFILENIYKPRPGDIYAVPGFNLPCKHIFFTIMPKWISEFDRDDKHLLHACRRSMEMARSLMLGSISFPLIAGGKHGFPPQRAARLIVQAVTERMDENFREVRLVAPDAMTLELFRERLTAIGWNNH